MGADDGGSSTGALIELARVLALDPAHRPAKWNSCSSTARKQSLQFTDPWMGCMAAATTRIAASRDPNRNLQFKCGILWDMIGPTDREHHDPFPRTHHRRLARTVIFDAADKLSIRKNFSYFRSPILDDHTPLNLSPTSRAIDLIDFELHLLAHGG